MPTRVYYITELTHQITMKHSVCFLKLGVLNKSRILAFCVF